MARPAGELLLVEVDRWFRTGTRAAESAGALWEPLAAARRSGGLPARAKGDVGAFARHYAAALVSAAATLPSCCARCLSARGPACPCASRWNNGRRAASWSGCATFSSTRG